MSDPGGAARDRFDYVVVGGGSAGCIVAAELSVDPAVRVLLLEAGDRAEDHPETLAADGYKKAFINDALIWERFSTAQPGCAGNRLFLGSGRGMGGSGSVNAMVYTRGDAADYAQWQVQGWRWEDLSPDFSALEARLGLRRMAPSELTETFIHAAEEAGFSRKEDLNDGALCGFLGYEWMNHSEDNRRRSAYAAFLKDVERPNLVIRTNARAQRLRLEGNRAVEVEYSRNGASEIARASREIVVCAGALESPRLLLLSGIGPADELRALGIPPVVDAAGVGRNLQDHPNVQVFYRGHKPTDYSWAQLYGFHRANPETALAPGQADTCYVFYSARSSFKEGALRLLPGILLPRFLYGKVARAIVRAVVRFAFALPPVKRLVDRMYAVVVILGKPKSRGVLRLTSSSPEDPAAIDPAYFAEREDLDTLVRGVKLARRIADAGPLRAWGNRATLPGRGVRTDEQIARFIRKNAMTTYHYAGTCRMGEDSGSVVDPRLRVRGVTGLRVADASVIPVVPVSAMNAPSMLIGWRAARFLREDAAVG